MAIKSRNTKSYNNVLVRSFIVGLVLLFVSSCVSFVTIRKANESSDWVDHTHTVISKLELIISYLKDMETGARGYLLTGNTAFLQPYNNTDTKVQENIEAVKSLTVDNAQQQQTMPQLQTSVQRVFGIIKKEIALKQGGQNIVDTELQAGKAAMDSTRSIIQTMQQREDLLLQQRTQKWENLSSVTPLLIVLLFATGVSFASYFAHKLSKSHNKQKDLQHRLEKSNEDIQQRISIIQNIAKQIAAGEYTLRLHEKEKDMLGSLSENLNDMASSLEYSFNILKELNKKKDDFIGIAAHELKTPMASIKAYLQLMSRAKLDSAEGAQIFPFITRANNQVNRMTAIVSDLLDVTRINDGRLLLLRQEEVSIRELIVDASREVFMHTRLHNLQIEGNPDVTVYVDRFRIEQVFINLISNSVKYSAPNTNIVILVQKEEKFASISVTDFGMGIPQDKQPFIFERYFRVEDSSANQPGLGLGLYITKNIVKQHGGTITVHSKEGTGTTVTFTLPLAANS